MLNPDYTFKNYLITSGNKVARNAIGLAIASLGQIHNPLFIYGPIGVGKTHLLQALVQESNENKPSLKIHYATSEQFVDKIIQSIQRRNHKKFVDSCMSLDILLIDDIHLMKDKKFTLEELLHIFKRLYDARKQVVITADRPVTQIFKTKGRAVRIFQKGLSLKLWPPGYNERLRFLQAKARNAGLQLGDDIFEDIVRNGRPDFRELEGALAKARHHVLL